MQDFTKNRIPLTLVVTISLIVVAFIFGPIFWSPNQHLMMVGGDGGMLYFNILYHAWYGDGLTLGNLNYLDPECILMTASQASVATSIRTLSKIFPGIAHYSIGIVHVLFMMAILVQNICLYLVLRKMNIRTWMSVVFALCIGSLAPQLVRIGYGHFGLSYPFLIPMTFLWLMSDLTLKSNYKWTMLFFLVLMFLGFNNPYLMFFAGLLILVFSFFGLIVSRKKQFILKAGFGLVGLAVLYTVISLTDPFDDRIGQQWGHFYYASKLKGVFYDQYSILFKWLQPIIEVQPGRSETYATISLASIILLLIALFSAAFRQSKFALSEMSFHLKMMLLSASVIFLYSSAFFRLPLWEEFAAGIKPLTMIKSSGRLSWIAYYVLSISAVVVFSKLWQLLAHNKFQKLLLVLPLFWIYECGHYLDHFVKVKHYENSLTEDNLSKYTRSMDEVVDFKDYQALLTIPVIQSWMDNLLVPSEWTTEIHAQSISLAKELPWINSRLSRAPVGRSLQNVQLTAHPLIERTLINRLNQNAPILLVKGNTHTELSIGENALLKKADHVFHSDQVDLYRIMPVDFNHYDWRDNLLSQCMDSLPWHKYLSFDHDASNQCGFFSDNGKLLSKEFEKIMEVEIPEGATGFYELSFWNFVNIEKHGMPNYNVILKNQTGKEIYRDYIDSRTFIDNQNGWLRTSKHLELVAGQILTLEGRGRYPMCMDELLLRPLDKPSICIPKSQDVISLNNYFINN